MNILTITARFDNEPVGRIGIHHQESNHPCNDVEVDAIIFEFKRHSLSIALTDIPKIIKTLQELHDTHTAELL